MPYIEYEEWNPSKRSEAIVHVANQIIRQYRQQGYLLTLRQLYYQFVARGALPNTQKSYNNLGKIIARARMSGLMDWEAIEDRTRNVREWQTHDTPQAALRKLRDRFTLEKWADQPTYVEVWVEKEALAGVFERICYQLEVPFFACRGYVSLSEMWSASQRLANKYHDEDKEVTILHFGDHDPSGIDMTRDIEKRTTLFGDGAIIDVRRIALTMAQVQQYSPPPNPAKMTDSRADDYVLLYGHQSWELDALDPTTLSQLVETEVMQLRDETLWEEAEEREAEALKNLERISERYNEVTEWLEENSDEEDDD